MCGSGTGASRLAGGRRFAAAAGRACPNLSGAAAWLEQSDTHRMPLFSSAAAIHAVLAPGEPFGLDGAALMRDLAHRELRHVRQALAHNRESANTGSNGSSRPYGVRKKSPAARRGPRWHCLENFSGGQPPVSLYAVRLRVHRPAHLPVKANARSCPIMPRTAWRVAKLTFAAASAAANHPMSAKFNRKKPSANQLPQ
jgi:hypothetical protein